LGILLVIVLEVISVVVLAKGGTGLVALEVEVVAVEVFVIVVKAEAEKVTEGTASADGISVIAK
jgi:hypothetical protein